MTNLNAPYYQENTLNTEGHERSYATKQSDKMSLYSHRPIQHIIDINHKVTFI